MNIELFTAGILKQITPPSKMSSALFDLSVGAPDEASLPRDALLHALQEILHHDPVNALIYAGTSGYIDLRSWIAKTHASSENHFNSDNVSLVSGSAHGLDNIARTFLEPNDFVLMSSPTYPGAIRTFQSCGAKILDIPSNQFGIDLNYLEDLLSNYKNQSQKIKMLYVVSSYNNPSGMSISNDQKKSLVELCEEYSVLIVDDRAYSMITFENNPDPSLSTVRPSENIIEVGTFSKTIATGIRVAWVMASKSIITNLNLMRFDNGGSSLMQRMVFNFVDSSHYSEHLTNVKKIYKRKRDIVSDALVKYCSDSVDFHIPQGGFYHWVKIKNGLSNSILAENALIQGVGINVGNIYFVNRDDTAHFRIVYSKLKESDLENAVKILSTCFKH
tara:strand:+ start:154 stop:1320 length:1167 start_codon:yes stop_codon:yes gene_type:complete